MQISVMQRHSARCGDQEVPNISAVARSVTCPKEGPTRACRAILQNLDMEKTRRATFEHSRHKYIQELVGDSTPANKNASIVFRHRRQTAEILGAVMAPSMQQIANMYDRI